MRLFQHLALLVHKRSQWQNGTQRDRNNDAIRAVVSYLPKGGVFASGTHLDERSTGEELVLRVNYFHPKDEDGKWFGYTVFVRPSLLGGGFTLSIHGEDRLDTKDNIKKAFHSALELAVD